VQRSTVPLLLAAMPPTLSGVVPVSQAIVQSVTAMSRRVPLLVPATHAKPLSALLTEPPSLVM
jgi:hypothetical protein